MGIGKNQTDTAFIQSCNKKVNVEDDTEYTFLVAYLVEFAPNKIAKAHLVAAREYTLIFSRRSTACNRGIRLGNFATSTLLS